MKKILITGAAGQLGSELRDLYKERADLIPFFLDREQLALDDTSSIKEVLKKYNPDFIIHVAAFTAVDRAESEIELADKVNHLASGEIAKYCKEYGAKLIAISTDYVFDGNSSSPLCEDAEVGPINVYGETKLKGEQAIQRYCPQSIIIRTAWVYSTHGNNFVKTMLRLMNERDEITVINDQIGSPTYALDLARLIVGIIDCGSWRAGVYHYSNEGEISWFDFAVAIKEIKKLQCTIHAIPTSAYPTPAKRPKFSLLNKSKIKNTYAIKIPYWKDSLIEMLNKISL
ncbi:dTDP-4-dehydrorhamnose reductase [Sphingobacterium sp. SGL-16]|uniref:dTDP-4-dehydrorhamnose reductase n=1 Tax=Sphingobacterium sp. SGL-16 TaxID=2710883 RepID=UPI0013EE0DE7|nr:dTDP-4-dehydrorhamnose reductase [Sphingobacterium sp. SGL-16]NGM73080.1 dTDP-4-dehydrorhamnose reductase [Sphingobacterium sp. SGL-16]